MEKNYETYYDGVFNGLDLVIFTLKSFKANGLNPVNIDDVLNILESNRKAIKLEQEKEQAYILKLKIKPEEVK